MGWLDRLFGRQQKSSTVAKDRLQMVLTHDRADISPGLIAEIKDDIIAVIARRLAVDPDSVVVTLTTTARESRLVAESPLHNRRRQAP